MAEPVVRVEPTRVAVEPGGQAVVAVTVFNPGTVVEGYAVDVVSATPLPWATASPETLSVYPQQEASTTVTFSPPREPGTPSGTVPFGVRVRSQVDPLRSAVAEGDLDVGTVSGLHAALTPVTSSGRWSGRHTLEVDNFGNSPARLSVAASDPDEALGFLVSPAVVEVPPGGRAYARVKVRTRHPVLRGAAQRLPFKVVCEPETPPAQPPAGLGPMAVSTPDRPVVDAGFNQKPILDRWVVLAAGLLLAALVALVVWAVQRGGTEPAEDDTSPSAPDQPTGLRADAVAPGLMALTWDSVEAATAYKVRLTEPASDEFPTPGQQVEGSPGRLQFRMETDRVARHCYVVVAVREGASDSVPSEQVCASSLAVEGAPEPTSAPEIVPAPGFETPAPNVETATPGPTDSPGPTDPTTSPTPTPTPTDTAPPETPPVVTVLKAYDSGNVQAALDELQVAQDAGVTTVRLGVPEELGLELPPGLTRVLYVAGASEAEALQACEAVLAEALPIAAIECSDRSTYRLAEGTAALTTTPAVAATP